MLIFMFTLTETLYFTMSANVCSRSRCHDMLDFKTMPWHAWFQNKKFEFRTILCHWATLVQTTASLCGLNLGVARTIESSCIAVIITLIATKRTELHTSSHGQMKQRPQNVHKRHGCATWTKHFAFRNCETCISGSCNRISTALDDADDAVACSIRTDIPFSKWNSDHKTSTNVTGARLEPNILHSEIPRHAYLFANS